MNISVQDSMLDRVRRINWFEHCGERSEISIDSGLRIMYVDSLDDAIKYGGSDKWHNFTLEAKNQLTSYLHDKFRTDYQKWNDVVMEIKNELDFEALFSGVQLGLSEQVASSVFDNVRWDILGLLMADAYRKTNHKQRFFLNLLAIYEAGHLPCGWVGKKGPLYNCDLTVGAIRVY